MKWQKRSLRVFSSATHPFLSKLQNHTTPSFLNQIILNSLSSLPIKILKKLLQWQNHQRSKKGLQPLPRPPELDATEPSEHSQHPPSISSSTLFSSEEQCIWYNSLFASRSIIYPKLLDLEFFDDEMFDCFQAFQNSGSIQFMTIKLPYYPDLVRVFYSNLEIQNGTLISEV